MSKDKTPAELGAWLAQWPQLREQLAGQIEQEDRAGRMYGRYGQATIDAVDAALIDLEALARLLATGGNGRGE